MKNFYNDLALEPGTLKKKMKESETAGDISYYGITLTLRAVLVVLFAVVFIGVMTALFGSENSAMATVMFVLVLMFRFIGFGYDIRDSLVTFAIVVAILVFMPSLAMALPAVLAFFVNLIALMAILCITTQVPQMGFAGFFGFAYSYLVGNAVQGTALLQRAGMGLICYIICALILFHKHRDENKGVHFIPLLKKFRFTNLVNLWQIRLALGVSIILTVGAALGVDRFMWLAFACSTVLAQYPYSRDTQTRFYDRILGISIGSLAFYVLFQLIPESFLSLVGLVGGVVLGFCDKYRWKTIVICFGALSIAAEIYGVGYASMMRILNNFIGALFGMLFALLFDVIVVKHLVPKEEKSNA